MDTIQTNDTPKRSVFSLIIRCAYIFAAVTLTLVLLWNTVFHLGNTNDTAAQDETAAEVTEPLQFDLMVSFDVAVGNAVSDAYDGAKSVKKVFWINEDELAPEPNAACYGETDDPASLQWLLDEAAEILDGQELTFSTETEIYAGTKVNYYLDDSIFAITWKEVRNNFIYTLSEVKVAHPSQVGRYIAEETYGSNYYYQVNEMAEMNNAVTAISGDYYRTRNYGIVVYEGTVYQVSAGNNVDTCFVDENGDFHFTYRGEILDLETAQKYVDENNISFSLAFGPVLVDNGVRCEPASYALGEVNDEYPRAAICQKDTLHYLLVAANWDGPYYQSPDIHTFASVIETYGVQKAYTLDGGQTGAISFDGQLMSPTRGLPRSISDIIYFASAVPNNSADTQTEPEN